MAIEIDVTIQWTDMGCDPNEVKSLLTRVCRAVLDAEAIANVSISFLITSDEDIQRLNHEYRHVDTPTDVLSFPQLEPEEIALPSDWPKPLGDVVISYETAIRQAEQYGHSLLRELAYLAVHGVLHLLGYDHDQDDQKMVMRQKEEAILSALGHTR